MRHLAFFETTALLGGILAIALHSQAWSSDQPTAAAAAATHEFARAPFTIEHVHLAEQRLTLRGTFAGSAVVLTREGRDRLLITRSNRSDSREISSAEASLFASMLARSSGNLDEASARLVSEMVQALTLHARTAQAATNQTASRSTEAERSVD